MIVYLRAMRWVAVAMLAGCGFHPQGGDLGAADLAGVDLKGVDLRGADLAGVDLAGGGGTGAGPLGALPTGFCCHANSDCRSRDCVSIGGGPTVCLDHCASDPVCAAWSPMFHCDQGSGSCAPVGGSSTCLDPSGYHYGDKAIGTCCASGFVKSGQECLGGLCEATGNDANPFYCTQGCDQETPCPSPYECAAGFCWIPQTISDPNFMYTCQ